MIIEKGTKIITNGGGIGVVVNYQPRELPFAEHYVIKFDDFPIALCIPPDCLKIYQEKNYGSKI